MQFGEGLKDTLKKKIGNVTTSIKDTHKKVSDKIKLIGKDIKESDLYTDISDYTNELYSDGDIHNRQDCKVFVSIDNAKKIKSALNKHISDHTTEYLECTAILTKKLNDENEKFNNDNVPSSMSNPERAKKLISENQHKIAECNKKFLAGVNKRINIDSGDVKCILTLKKVNSTKIDTTTRNITTFEGNVVGIDPKNKTILVKVDSSVKKGHEIEIKIENLCVGGKEMPKKEDVPESEEKKIPETNVDDNEEDNEKIDLKLNHPIETQGELAQECKRMKVQGGGRRRKY